jgi:hypothetical protein
MMENQVGGTVKEGPFVSLGLMREFEKGRKVAEWMGDRAYTPDGDAYVVLAGTGGESGARTAFAAYAEGRNGALHWRALPEIHQYTKDRCFWMRLFIEKD